MQPSRVCIFWVVFLPCLCILKFYEDYVVYVRIMTGKGPRYIYYTPSSTSGGKINNTYIHIGLGEDSRNGTWQTFSRDLSADLQTYEPDNTLTAVNAFLIRGNGLIDNIKLEGNIPTSNIYEDTEVPFNP